MRNLFCFIFSLILTNAIYSQSNPTSEKKPHPELAADDSFSNGAYATGLQSTISMHEKNVLKKIASLEKLQMKVAEINQSLLNKIVIKDEVPVLHQDTNPPIVSSRTIEISFQDHKVKEVKIISSKRNLKNDLNSVIRTLTFEPANFSEIKISVDRFESKVKGFPQVESYKDMPSEAKIHVIKLIDDILVNAIFRFDTFVQKSKEGKLEATINNVKEL